MVGGWFGNKLQARAGGAEHLWCVHTIVRQLQEVKAGDVGRTRALFERATSLQLPARKMKGLFKRWLDWERREGGPAEVEAVKQRAMEFVQRSAAA